jgi:hypothetical protein
MNPTHEFLRHALATLAYRASKAVREAPESFATFKASPTTRTPGEILAHMVDLMDWGLSMSRDKPVWRDSPVLPWSEQIEGFFASLSAWDAYLASDAPLATPPAKIFQGPIADALTHTGQINLLRRMAGSAVRGESYARASIAIGQTGPDQPAPLPGSEFD